MKKSLLSTTVTGLAMAFACAQSYAASPLVGIVEGENWDLPIVPSASLFIQSGMVQHNVEDYDSSGSTKPSATAGTNLEGMTRFAHAFSFQAMPDIGFLIEAFQPEVSKPIAGGNGNTVTGLGDPFVHMLAYKRFLDNNLLLGVGNILSIPVGNNEISNHAWIDAPNIVADYKIGNFGFDGTLASAYFTQLNFTCAAKTGCVQPGNLYTAEAAVRYTVAPWFVPFVSYTVQTESGTHLTGAPVTLPGSREGDLGIGARFPIEHLRWFSIWYYGGVNGSSTTKTNAVYFKFATGV